MTVLAAMAVENDLTAIILCGGRGERLRPYTDTLPKALVPLHGQPLLHHVLLYLKLSGVNRFVLCVGHLAGKIERFVAGSEFRGVSSCVNSGDVSMIDRILDASSHVGARALICYGDTLANVDISALLSTHRASNAAATLTVYPLHSPFGIVEADAAGRVTAFAEKPRLPYWINIGYLLCEREAFATMRRGTDMDAFLGALARAGRLFAYRHSGKHLTVNTEKERTLAEEQIVEFLTVMDA
jgi:glucose-1-phosphate cytidylyltransferase